MAAFGINLREGPAGHVAALEDHIVVSRALGVKQAAVQIFATGPKSYDATMNCAELSKFAKTARKHDVKVIVHGSFLDNPWRKNYAALSNICAEMELCATNGFDGVVVHLSRDAAANVAWVIEKMCAKLSVHTANTVRLWLEIAPLGAATEGSHLERHAELAELFERIGAILAERGSDLVVGLCVDTAHLWACGVSVSQAVEARAWLSELDSWKDTTPIMLHLNDSQSEFGSGQDRHGNIGSGNIWGLEGQTGYEEFIRYAHKNECITILETPDSRKDEDLALIVRVLNKVGTSL